MTDSEIVDAATRAAQAAVNVQSMDMDPMVAQEEALAAQRNDWLHGFIGSGDAFLSLKGNSKRGGQEGDPDPVYGDAFSFVSGDDSNVVVTIDKNDMKSGRVKIVLDVYYV